MRFLLKISISLYIGDIAILDWFMLKNTYHTYKQVSPYPFCSALVTSVKKAFITKRDLPM